MLAGQGQLVSVPAATVLLSAVLPQLLKKPSSWVHSVSVRLVDLAGSLDSTMSVPRPSVTSQGSQDDDSRPLRSKGLLPAIGVGAAVYWITGIASVTTLGLVGIGAGVGYGVGSWIADKMQKKGDAQNKVQMDQLPWAVQVALQHWQEFVTRQAAGRQLTPADVDTIWAQFEQYEPTHAANARALVRGSGAASEPLRI
ncbi:unnamed protein product [Symbiodinium microadriaticum]|nr:unnamed protein product [Symbiodinium sp. KB8]CAE7903811.1 unnamed protein product [Symbiodinium microadriaticum]